MSFAHPAWFWAFAGLPLLVALFFRNEIQRSLLLRKLVAARLEKQLAGNVSPLRRRVRFLIVMLGLVAIILSLAQPRWGYTWEKEKHHGRDILLAIDVSRSMLANDLSPSRLARAKLAAEDLITQLGGDRVGLIAFAGTAFLQAPLTFDHGAVLSALRELDSDIIPQGGTDIAEAIHTAVDAFGKGESDDRALVLFTDGEELEENAISAAAEVKGAVRIFTVGMGSAEGTVIALPGKGGQTEYVKDAEGQIVKSRLDEGRLREIAQTTNGFYTHLISGPPEMQQIIRDGLEPMSQHDEADSQLSRKPIERYQFPLAAGMLLLASTLLIGERKRNSRPRAVATAAVLLLAGFSGSASAKNNGIEAYEKKDYNGAFDSFEKQLEKRPDSDALQFDLGSAAYKKGDLDRAMQGFSSAITSTDPGLREKAEYNLGNTLFQRGINQKEKPAKLQELKNALQHYEAALKVQAQDENAKYNRDAVKNLITELEKEPPKSDDKKDQDKKDQKDQQKKDQKNDPNQKKNQDQKDQKDQKDQQQQKQDQKDQKDQGQQDKQDQQSKDQKGQQQDKSQDQKQQDGSKSDQQKQDQKDGQKDQSKSGKEGDEKPPQAEQGEGKDKDRQKNEQDSQKGQDQKDQKDQQQQPKSNDGSKSGEQQPPPSAPPEQPDRKLSGEIKGAKDKPPEDTPPTPEQQAAEDARAASEGRMTEGQARDLLESLKDDDRRVRLLNPKGQKAPPRNFRDW